ncbi:MAG: dicarboxylate/amino acid:cation symporter [Vicinamibacterales bacterium]
MSPVKLHTRLLLALVAGAVLGLVLHDQAATPWLAWTTVNLLQPIGQLFLRTIFMIVVPMVFSALAIGVYELGRGHDLKGVAGRTLVYTVLLSTLSVVIAVGMVNLIRPGARIDRALIPAQSVQSIEASAAAARSVSQTIVELIPRNPLDSAVRALDGEMLPFMVFALVFGLAISAMPLKNDQRPVIVEVLEQIFDACMRIVHFAMRFSPIAVFAIILNTTLTFGSTVFAAVLLYVVTVVVGLLIQQFVVYGVAIRVFAARSPIEFFRQCRDVYLYAFSTASSNATLPLSIEVAETKLHLPPRIARFALTVGSTANQNGTALFEGVTVLFLAQVYGLDLTIGQQVRVMLMSILAGVGTAGVPGGSLPMVLIVAQSVGIPAEGMGLILGVDRFLDMCRSAVNVSGDLVIATLVSPRLKRSY